jgi:hypothetical protein
MRTIAILASVLALSVVSAACVVEEEPAPAKSGKTKKKKNPPNEDTDGEHGTSPPAGNTEDPPEDGAVLASETWDNGKALDATSNIPEGATVTIAPGATVNVAKDVALTVYGTLKVAAGTNHAKLTGAAWKGLVIGKGGKLDVDGLEITGATQGIATEPENGPSTFKNGAITAASPFVMQAGSNLTVENSTVVATAGSSIKGTFVADYMTYTKGSGAGLTQDDPNGSMTIKNSKLGGPGGGDYVISNDGKNVVVTRSAISGSHCALHFSGKGTAAFTIDGVDIRNNGVGGMLYNSGAGPNVVKNTTFTANNEYDISFGGNANGNITFDNVFGNIPEKPNVTQTAKAAAELPPTEVGPPAAK